MCRGTGSGGLGTGQGAVITLTVPRMGDVLAHVRSTVDLKVEYVKSRASRLRTWLVDDDLVRNLLGSILHNDFIQNESDHCDVKRIL
jgi:hypothetical protein